jgi:hypothetical protein
VTLSRFLAATAALTIGLSACGGDDAEARSPGEVLAAAEERAGGLRRGVMSLRVAASAGGADPTGPVGFALDGSFSFDGDGDLPVLDLTYRRLLGDSESATAMRSTGRAAFVSVDGATYQLPDDQLAGLRRADGAGLGALGVAEWFTTPVLDDGEPIDGTMTHRVTGQLDAAAMLVDLAAVDDRLGGGSGLPALSPESAERLRGLAEGTTIELLVNADDRLPRRLTASARLHGRVPAELQEALGRAADARLDVSLELSELDEPLEVAAPAGALPLPAGRAAGS